MDADRLTIAYSKEIDAPLTDGLTRLYTHGVFQILLNHYINYYNRNGLCFTLAIVNIDWFYFFNRKSGYVNGDKVLKAVSDLIQKTIRQVDIASRYANDQFAILLVDCDAENAFCVAERLRSAVDKEFDGNVTISIGLASCPEDGGTKDILIQSAMEALYAAKSEGKNKVAYHRKSVICAKKTQKRVLIVDDSEMNVKMLEAMLRPYDYEIFKAYDGEKALHIAAQNKIDIVLLDVMMPGMDGFEVCQRLKSQLATRMIPVILVTALDDSESKIKGMKAGADDFITKPPNKAELITRTKSLMKLKTLYNDFTSIESVLFSLIKTIEAKSPYTNGHVSRVASMAVALGRRMQLDGDKIEALRFGGVLHDIGKIGIPNNILNKPGPLDPNEWRQIQAHPETGYQIAYPLKSRLKLAMEVIRHHHEKLDGSGYPDGLKGDDIPMVARIIAVADIYDALTTDRPYRKALTKKGAFDILLKEANEKKIDKRVVYELINFLDVDQTAACYPVPSYTDEEHLLAPAIQASLLEGSPYEEKNSFGH